MTRSMRRWAVWVGVVALLLAGGGWLGWQGRVPGMATSGSGGGRADPASAAQQGPGGRAADPQASAALRAGLPRATDGLATTAFPSTDDTAIPAQGLEFCGGRRVSADELRRWKANPEHGRAEADKVFEQMQRAGDAALTRLAARLAAGDERQQVAARLLMRDVEGAAAVAERSRDAQAYQMALSACRGMAGSGGIGGSSTGPACGRLSIQRWAELDPSDARPWLRLMREGAAGMGTALAEAASRPRWSRASSLLEAQLLAVADAVPDEGELGNALVLAIGLDAAMDGAWDVPLLSSRACSGEALRDATRAAQCRTLAPRILAQTYDIAEAQAAQSLADRLGVPREQQAHDAATLRAAAARRHEAQPELNPTCESLQALRQFSAARVSSGELGLALTALRASQPVR